MAHANRELLPVEGEINHDGKPLKIIRRLKPGLTGEVYEGNLFIDEDKSPLHVAVKVMKVLEFPTARRFFLQESETLAFLMHLEKEANKEQDVDLKIAPQYFGRGEYEGNPYLVMEFIEGKEIPDLLEESENGCFTEKQALIAGWHLYRTLDVLHKLLRKTYIDLKFENLWWVDASQQLKLTDFGTLEEIKSGDISRRGVSRDILLGAVFFCKMATGELPNYSLGVLNLNPSQFRELTEKIQNADLNLSWGTQIELKTLLHPNPARRPMDAADVARRLRTLVDFWSKKMDQVVGNLRSSLNSAQKARDEASANNRTISEDGLKHINRARSALEIIERRIQLGEKDPDIHIEKEKLENLSTFTNHLERGKELLLGRQYSLAKQVFHEGMEWEWGDVSTALRRRAYLAEIGDSVSPTLFEEIQEDAFNALDDLKSGKWENSIEKLNKIQSVLEAGQSDRVIPGGLKSLLLEARLFKDIQNGDEYAKMRDFQNAAKSYDSANEHLKELPDIYKKFIRDNELGDLEELAKKMHERREQEEKKEEITRDYDKTVQYVKDDKGPEALKLAEETYRLSCALSHETERLSEIIHAALEKRKYELAFDLAQIILVCGKITPALQNDLNLTKSLNCASASLRIPDSIQFSESILGALEFASSIDVTGGCIQDLIEKAERKADITEDPDLYSKLAELIEKFGKTEKAKALKINLDAEKAKVFRAEAKTIYERNSDDRHAVMDRLIADAQALLLLPKPFEDIAWGAWTSYSMVDLVPVLSWLEERYKLAQKLILQAETIARVDEYRLADINRIKEEVDGALKRLSADSSESIQISKQKYEDGLFILNQWWAKIEPLFQWNQRSRELFGDKDPLKPLRQQLYDESRDFLSACYAVWQGEEVTKLVAGRVKDFENYIKKSKDFSVSSEDSTVSLGAGIDVLITNAKNALNLLGPEGWQKIEQDAEAMLLHANISLEGNAKAWEKIKEDAEKALAEAKASLDKAAKAFADGDLDNAPSLLDQAKPIAGGTDEWKKLFGDTWRAMVWVRFQKDHAEEFSTSQHNPNLLQAIRKYAAQKLPAKYWSGSPAEKYLDRIRGVIQKQIKDGIHQPTADGFLELVKQALDVSWTAQLVSSQTQIEKGWKAEDWLKEKYPLIYKKDVTALASAIKKAPVPEQIESALLEINSELWNGVAHLEENKQKKITKSANTRRWWLTVVIIILAVVCGALILAGFLARDSIKELYYGTPTSTATITPSITPTLEVTYTPTLSPTPTSTATPLTPSIYLVPNPNVVYPVVPDSAESVWVIPPQNAHAAPAISDEAVWKKETSADGAAKGDVFYSTQKAVNVLWTTDQPLAGGWYSIYILDTKTKSGGYGNQTYFVSSNQVDLLPFRGQSSVIFDTETQGQKADRWLSLGVYEIPAGQTIEVRTSVPDLSGNARFALSRLLIVKITEPQKSLYDLLPSERVLSLVSDDVHVTVLDTAKMSPLLPDYQGLPVIDPNSWGEGYRSLSADSLDGISTKVSIRWDMPGNLAAGKYQLLIWIPAANASAEGEFSMLLNGKPLEKQTLPRMSQADHAGQWWTVDLWSLPEAGSISVLFTVDVAANAGRTIGIDAIVLVKVE